MKPRYTDLHRYQMPYITAKESEEPGYLAARFKALREQQEKDAAEATAKVRDMKKRKTA